MQAAHRTTFAIGAVLAAIVAACQGGTTIGLAPGPLDGPPSASGGGAVPPSAGRPPFPKGGPPSDPEATMPDVDCNPDPEEADPDASSVIADAGEPDADAAAPFQRCPTLPFECVSDTMKIVWGYGVCNFSNKCEYSSPSFENCPGGCFKQVDGGNHCNE